MKMRAPPSGRRSASISLAAALTPSCLKAQDLPQPPRRDRPLAPHFDYTDQTFAGRVVGRALALVPERRPRNWPDFNGRPGLDFVDDFFPGQAPDPGWYHLLSLCTRIHVKSTCTQPDWACSVNRKHVNSRARTEPDWKPRT